MLVAATGVTQAAPPGPNWPLQWHDEFSGTKLDASKWKSGAMPWGGHHHNNEYASTITDEDTWVRGGSLFLQVRKGDDPKQFEGYPYSEGFVHTDTKMRYTYGYVEIRARFPAGKGQWPAFWTLSDGWPPEFDIAEYFGTDNRMHNGVAYGTCCPVEWDSTSYHDDYTKWHTYGLEWGPGVALWYQDGRVRKSVAAEYITDKPMYLILQSGMRWDKPEGTVFPNLFQVDYVRLWSPPASVLNDGDPAVESAGFHYTGAWESRSKEALAFKHDVHAARAAGSACEIRFTGDRADLHGLKGPAQGHATVSLDGGKETRLDTYAPERTDGALLWSSKQLTPGPHVLRVIVTGKMSAKSTGAEVALDRLNVWNEADKEGDASVKPRAGAAQPRAGAADAAKAKPSAKKSASASPKTGSATSKPQSEIASVLKGYSARRWRGAMIPPDISADSLKVLGREWGANHVRWQLTWDGFPHGAADNATPEAYDAWLDGALDQVDKMLPVCEANGLKVLVDLHSTPGGRNQYYDCRLFEDIKWQDQFIAVWEKIARRFKGNTTVWGYDLANEPSEGTLAPGVPSWNDLALKTARLVRSIDPDHTLVIEPAPWAAASAFANWKPLPMKNVVYSFHYYEPQAFTHQGVFGKPVGVKYPGVIDGKQWDKAEMERAMAPVKAFAAKYRVPIYVGEFSAIRWAPDNGAYRYLKDALDVFEANGWSWCYHAFREWQGWSVEHDNWYPDTDPSPTQTDREKLLRAAFKRNQGDRKPK